MRVELSVLNIFSASANDHSIVKRLSRAALVCAVAATCALASGQRALADDDDDDEPFETKIMKSILGINDKDSIDYRERAPLVVPPTMNLAPPEQAKIDNPAWPKDASIQERKKRRAAAKQPRRDPELDARPLTPAELNPNGIGRPGAGPAASASDNAEFEGQRKLKPNELGYKGGLFDSIFRDTSKPESAVFTGEPARSALTDPPPGYMTPSPSHPYGLGVKKEAPKPYKLEDRGTGNN